MAAAAQPPRTLAVLLHADVVDSTKLVQHDESLAHARITAAYQRLSKLVEAYGGTVREIRGDALVAEFARASDAVCAAAAFQSENIDHHQQVTDTVVPEVRIGIALGEVVIADATITGPGIVLAQRVEQLAAKNGVCVTAAVHEAVPGRLPIEFEEIGLQIAKGFDDPVHVYAAKLRDGARAPAPDPIVAGPVERTRRLMVSTAAVVLLAAIGTTAWFQFRVPDVEPARPDKLAYTLPDKPSIAVLPFDNMTGSPENDYLGDGLTENIIAVLAGSPELLVIARNSTFVYKGKPVKPQEVAEQLGVKYVLEGSVQGGQEKVRVTAQLIDALNGQHVWAQRYDRDFDDLTAFLEIQDDIAQHILVALDAELAIGSDANMIWDQLQEPEAYKQYIRARELLETANASGAHKEAKAIIAGLLSKYPQTPVVLNLAGWVHYWEAVLGISSDRAGSIATMADYAAAGLEVDETHAWSHAMMALARAMQQRCEESIRHANRVMELTPTAVDSVPTGAVALDRCGRSAEAADVFQRSMRANPHHAVWMPIVQSRILTTLGHLDEAKAFSESLLSTYAKNPRAQIAARRNLAVIAVWEDDLGLARTHVRELLRLNSRASVSGVEQAMAGRKDEAGLKRYLEALRQAGLPDRPPG